MMRAAAGCAVVLMIATTSAWANNDRCHQPYQLGGTFAGTWVGDASDGTKTRIEFTLVQAPLDSAGRTAAINVEWLSVGKDFENLWQLLGIEGSKVVGEMVMIDRDTARYTMIWYGISTGLPKEIRAIYTLSGKMDFKGPDKLVDRSTIRIYLTNTGVQRVAPVVGGPWPYGDADVDHDLLPDVGAVPFIEKSFEGALSKRVPLLP
jgi:hypothetical protein